MNFLKKSAFCHKCVANGAMKQMESGGNGEPDEAPRSSLIATQRLTKIWWSGVI